MGLAYSSLVERVMRCATCSFENRDGVRFCENCGNALASSTPCASCGEFNRPGVSFCENCGNALSAAEPCPSCGELNRPGVAFCENCGTRIAVPVPAPVAQTLTEPVPSGTGFSFRGLVTALVAAAVVGALAGGAWLLTRSGNEQSFALGLAPDLTAAQAAFRFVESPLGTDPSVVPSLGVTVEASNGSLYHHDGRTWTAITPGGNVWILPETEVSIPIDAGRLVPGADLPDFVREVLDALPGVDREGEGYSVGDPAAVRESLGRIAAEHGVWAEFDESGLLVMVKELPTGFVWIEPGDDYVWIADESAAVLGVETESGLVTAGRLVGEGDALVWEDAPGAGALDDRVAEIVGEARRGSPLPYDSADVTVRQVGGEVEGDRVLGSSRPDQGCAGVVSCVNGVYGNGEATAGWQPVARYTPLALLSFDNPICPILVGLFSCGVAEASTSAAMTTMEIVDILWDQRGNIFGEKACDGGSPGPGRGPDGRGTPAYDISPAAYSLDGAQTPFTEDWQERLELARSWMPLVEFSHDEQCGEVLRVFAKVHAYGPDGEEVSALARAERVEIAYTLFFKEDGGRFEVLMADHPGDNEGFVVGLVRTDDRSGRCATGFEFVAGRTVGHSDAGGALVQYLEANARQIDDFDGGDVGTGCPVPGDTRYRVLVAEGKHATYYHRDQCERALLPNLPAMVVGMIVGGIPGALTADALLKLAELGAPGVVEDLQDGLEECEEGRPLEDLSGRVELFSEELRAVYGEELLYYDTYETETGPKTYEAQARGRFCFGPGSSSLPRYPNCDYDFHVPGFFGYPAAGLGVEVPPLLELTEAAARSEVESRGLTLYVIRQAVDHANGHGIVLTQEPDAGDRVPSGSQVTVRVGVYGEAIVPDLIDLPLDEAADLLASMGFDYQVRQLAVPSEEAWRDGLIVDQNPDPGVVTMLPATVRIYVGVFEGPAMVAVPDLGGLTESTARSEVQSRGLVFQMAGEIETSDSGYWGRVLDQDPISGTVEAGSTIRVWLGVDDGPDMVAVPDLGGLTESAARSEVESRGLVFQVAGYVEMGDSGFWGRVIDQDPISGTVEEGSTIRVWLGMEPEFTPSFPPEEYSSWGEVYIQGYPHGSTIASGTPLTFCYYAEPDAYILFELVAGRSTAGSGGSYQYIDDDFFPASSWPSGATRCFNGIVNTSGYMSFRISTKHYQAEVLPSDIAQIWVYVP